jgi:hypothetical protein
MELSLGESLHVHTHAYIHGYMANRPCLDKQSDKVSLFSPLLPECVTLERVSASFFSLHWTYSLHTASLSASTVHPSTLGWGFGVFQTDSGV